MDDKELIIINEVSISEKIYEIRGQKVMLDFELAEIYGYETKDFNNQVKRNIERFDSDFRFRLTKEEVDEISRLQKSTSMSIMQTKGVRGGRTSLPYAFTEQGIYMLMTVLKGDLAVQQSKAIIRAFKAMKDFIIEMSGNLLVTNELLKLANQVNVNTSSINEIKNKLSIVMDNFIDPTKYKHFLIFDGERIEADSAYQKIYSLAKHSIIIVDDYIGIKTLEHLKVCNNSINIFICSDNVAKNGLTDEYLDDFKSDTGLDIIIKPTNNIVHGRYVVIDYETDSEIIYHAGSSSKDAGNKISTIMKIEKAMNYHNVIDRLIK